MVKINGEDRLVSGMTLKDFLAAEGYESGRLAVERNGEIVPRASYGETVLEDGDSVEIVRFVGGG